MFILCISVILNSFCLYLLGNRTKVQRIMLSNLMAALSFVNLSMSLSCMVICVLNINFEEVYGHMLACRVQVILIGFFIFWEVWVLTLISYSLERRVCIGQPFCRNYQAVINVVLTGLFSLFISICTALLPSAGYHLYPSGTFCFYSLYRPVTFVGFMLGSLLPISIMAIEYVRIWVALKSANQELSDRGLRLRAKPRYSNMARRFFVFNIIYILPAIPLLYVAVYEWVTSSYSPPWVDISIGAFVHLNSALDPLLLFVLNDDVKDEIIYMYSSLVINVCHFGRCLIYQRITPVDISRERHSASQISNENVQISLYFNQAPPVDWKLFLTDKKLSGVFGKWCDDNYVGENFHFYIDVERYHELCAKMNSLFVESASMESPSVTFGEDFLSTSAEVLQLVQYIYELYIKVPSAPLEINIPASVTLQINNTLCIPGSYLTGSISKFPNFMDPVKFSGDDKFQKMNEIFEVFDEALATVLKIIETDVMPRFRRSAEHAVCLKSLSVV